MLECMLQNSHLIFDEHDLWIFRATWQSLLKTGYFTFDSFILLVSFDEVTNNKAETPWNKRACTMISFIETLLPFSDIDLRWRYNNIANVLRLFFVFVNSTVPEKSLVSISPKVVLCLKVCLSINSAVIVVQVLLEYSGKDTLACRQFHCPAPQPREQHAPDEQYTGCMHWRRLSEELECRHKLKSFARDPCLSAV